jgi:D-alanyl-D-alanine endopeptidase (penicillin-binding protein 7)
MNQKVKGIGMKDTQFEDPAGLSDKNISTADDLFVLGRYLYERQAYLLAITRQKGKTLVSSKFGPRELRNFNVFSSDPSFIGGKTGKTTPAKETMLSMFREQTPASVYNVAIIVLGSENRAADVAKLREWFRESTGGTLAQIR